MPRVVTFHYTLRDPSGQVLDTSAGGEPIAFLEGAGQIIDGLDEQLRGEPAGRKTIVKVPAARAYGLHDPAQVQRVLRTVLPVEGVLKVGDAFQAGPDRHAPVVKVVAIEGDGYQTEMLKSYMSAFDQDAYATSHVGWGMNPSALWDYLEMYDRSQVNGTEARAFEGNFLFSTGANENAGRFTRGHFDFPMRHCTVTLDGTVVVDTGRLI